MALSSRWNDRNLSRIELVVSILLISIFIGVFAFRALKIFALAERTSVTLTIGNINTALKYKALIALSKNDFKELEELEHFNPMLLVYSDAKMYQKREKDLMEKNTTNTTANYIGELFGPDINNVAPGAWYYDRDSNLLIYRVKNTEFFYSQLEGPARIRYEIKLDYDDENSNNEYDPKIDKFIDINLESVDKFEWNI